LFFANWEGNSLKLKNLAESLAGNSDELTIKTVDANDPNAAAIFDLYNVSAIPTVIVLSGGKQHMIASMVGSIREESLRNLITYHSGTRK
jgi:thioredoxin-like negative regulator of GroEL